jgi:hypothetical protein
MDDPGVLTAYLTGEVDDPVLDALTARESLLAPMGGGGNGGEADESLPWKLEVPPPIAVDLRRIQSALPTADQATAQALAAFAGSGPVILLSHCMTAMGRPGEKPPPVWGMGYTAELLGIDDAATLSVAPDTAAEKIATASGHLDVGLDTAGHLSVGKAVLGAVLPVLTTLPLPIPDIQFKASADTEFAIRFHLDVQALRVQAVRTGSGGAGWNLYHRGKELARSQVLVQTVALPRSVDRLRVRVETWIRRKTPLNVSRKASQWTPPLVEHDIPVR